MFGVTNFLVLIFKCVANNVTCIVLVWDFGWVGLSATSMAVQVGLHTN